MSEPDLRALLRSPALDLDPAPDVAARVVTRGSEVRRTNRRGVAGLVVLLAAVGLALGPGLPDRFVPQDQRQPAAQAARVLPGVEPATEALLRVAYLPGAYDSVRTERAVATCALRAELGFPDGRPVHEVAVEGAAAQVARVRACLARVPGAIVSTG